MDNLKQEEIMNKPDDYLRLRYGDRYRAVKGEDGIWNLATRHKPSHGTLFEVFDFSDEELAACLPPQTARSLMRRFPDTFRLVQDSDDAGVLVFEESGLDELADALKLRRRRRLSEEERRKKTETLRPYQFGPASKSSKTAPESTITRPGRSKVGFQAGVDSWARKSTPNAPHQSRGD